jgi:hypothetical protein
MNVYAFSDGADVVPQEVVDAIVRCGHRAWSLSDTAQRKGCPGVSKLAARRKIKPADFKNYDLMRQLHLVWTFYSREADDFVLVSDSPPAGARGAGWECFTCERFAAMWAFELKKQQAVEGLPVVDADDPDDPAT